MTELEEENRRLDTEVKAKTKAEDFVEHRGALFKRGRGGGYVEAVYCPKCRMSVGSLIPELPYACTGPCQWTASFTGADFGRIFSDLPK